MPFGYQNGPAVFQRVMQGILALFLWIFALVYIDDIVIFSKSFEDHLVHVELVLKAIKEAKFTLSLKMMPFWLSVANVIRAEGFSVRTINTQGESRCYPTTRQSKKRTRPTGISWDDGILFFVYSILCLDRSPIISATETRKQVEMGCQRTGCVPLQSPILEYL